MPVRHACSLFPASLARPASSTCAVIQGYHGLPGSRAPRPPSQVHGRSASAASAASNSPCVDDAARRLREAAQPVISSASAWAERLSSEATSARIGTSSPWMRTVDAPCRSPRRGGSTRTVAGELEDRVAPIRCEGLVVNPRPPWPCRWREMITIGAARHLERLGLLDLVDDLRGVAHTLALLGREPMLVTVVQPRGIDGHWAVEVQQVVDARPCFLSW